MSMSMKCLKNWMENAALNSIIDMFYVRLSIENKLNIVTFKRISLRSNSYSLSLMIHKKYYNITVKTKNITKIIQSFIFEAVVRKNHL